MELGADAAVDAQATDLTGAITDANAGAPVDIVLEMVGGTTFAASYAALAPFGRLITYGIASRRIPEPVDVVALNRDSRGVLGFWLAHCLKSPGMFDQPARELLGLVARGELRAVVSASYPLSEARRAHEDLRARRTVGKLVLRTRA